MDAQAAGGIKCEDEFLETVDSLVLCSHHNCRFFVSFCLDVTLLHEKPAADYQRQAV